MATKEPASVQVCGLCKSHSKQVISVQTPNGTILVGRCTRCDAAQCPKCNGRTIEIDKTECKHCGFDLTLKGSA